MMRRVLIGLALFFMATTFALLFALSWQYDRHNLRTETIRQLSKEIFWQSYRADKAVEQVKDLPELQFMARAVRTKNPYFHAIVKAAWKYGRALQKWKQVPNGPALVMAIIHRESYFISRSRSYRIKRDKNGDTVIGENGKPVMVPLAHGPAQINFAVWKDYFNLELGRMDDPDYNINHAVKIMDIYLEKRGGNVALMLWDYWGRGESWSYPPNVLESKFFNIHPVGGLK